MRRTLATAAFASLIASFAAEAEEPFGLLPQPPNSDARWAPIEALKKKGPGLSAAFAPHVHRNARGETMPYRLFTPERLAPGRTYPLVVFLHGAGGSGTDNRKQLEGANAFGALSWTLPENQAHHPAFVVAPQSDVNWACVVVEKGKPARRPADLEWCPTGVLGPGAALAFEIVDKLVETLPIDRARIYVTGHSMGGAGTWHMIAQRPGFFAAAVPVCGHPDLATAGTVASVPVWNFHGETDDVEPVQTSRRMIEALRKAGGRPRHTEYPGVGHNVFMWAYTEPALVEWLFARSRSELVGTSTESREKAARGDKGPSVTYLKRGVRTVIRWEKAEGLPVHRQMRQARGSVFASPSELEAWKASRELKLDKAPPPAAPSSRSARPRTKARARSCGRSSSPGARRRASPTPAGCRCRHRSTAPRERDTLARWNPEPSPRWPSPMVGSSAGVASTGAPAFWTASGVSMVT